MKFNFLRNFDLKNKNVLMRLDLNVPLKNKKITDDTRIKEALPTIQHAINQQAKVVLMSHLGRPEGSFDEKYSLAPVGEYLAESLGCEVLLVRDYEIEPIDQLLLQLKKNQIILLENLRFHKGETDNDQEFAQKLSKSMHFFVNDAFGAIHRAHASIDAVTQFFAEENRGIGFLIDKEIKALSQLTTRVEHPYVVVLGGAKVADKVGIILNLIPHCNHLIIGGAMAYSFLNFKGFDVGGSKIETDKNDLIARIFETAKQRKVEIHLPVDHVCASEFSEKAKAQIINKTDIPKNLMGLDIGPQSIKNFEAVIKTAKTVLWNGPVGVFEWPEFSRGTLALAKAISTSKAFTVVGGGDSVAAVNNAGVADKITHISTGGGASLEFLEGRKLPGLTALEL